MTEKKPIRIFIVDDHPMVIEGLSVMLHETPGIEVAGYATNAASCLGYFVNNRADVVLMDINLPDESGIELCLKVKNRQPDVHILGLSTINQLSNVRSMKKNGACGYLLKNASKAEIISAIEVANEGGEFWDSALPSTEEIKDQALLITRREKEVLQLIAEGLTNNEIADKIFVSTSTVDSHRKSLLSKFQVKNTAALVRVAIENKLIDIKS